MRAHAQNATASSIKVLYIIPSSHWDLGFLRPPREQMDAMKPHLDAVIRACEEDPQFRWTIESAWQLEAWLERTHDPVLIQKMRDLLRSGQIELSAAYGSMHTEFMGSEELNRLTYAAKSADARFGIHSGVAMMNDVPGFSARLPQVLARSGIHYLITGSNTALGGGMGLAPGKMPIYWKSRDGSSVLMWQTQGKNGGYTEGMADYFIDPDARDPYEHTRFYPKEWSGLSNLEIMHRGIDKLLNQYKAAGYKHSIAAVLYMHDGIGPEYELHGLIPNVHAWNAAGNQPHLVIATPAEFFSAMKSESGFPTYGGDWSGLWSAVKLNSPAMSADARWLQDELPRLETLWTLSAQDGASYPKDEIASAYQQLFFYDEHNGSGQGGWPKLLSRAEVEQQNEEYGTALRSAKSSAASLLVRGMLRLASERTDSKTPLVLVYNPTNWTFSGMSRLPSAGRYTVIDQSSGREMKTQRDERGTTFFEVEDVPPLGYRTYRLEPAHHADREPVADLSVLHSPFFHVEVDRRTGEIVRITDLRTHWVLLDSTHKDYAGRLIRESEHTGQDLPDHNVILHTERGPLFERLTIERPDSDWPQTVITLPQQRARIDLSETLDRERMSFVPYKEHAAKYSFGFKMSVLDQTQRLISNGEGTYRFPEDLLPGARRDAVVPRHTLEWNSRVNGHPYQIMLAQEQSFFDELPPTKCNEGAGGCTAGTRVAVLLKSDQAETRDHGVVTFRTYEPGYPMRYVFNFSLKASLGNPDPIAAEQFEAQDILPSVLLLSGTRPQQWSKSMLSINAPNVILQVLKPSRDGKAGDLTLRLREIAGRNVTIRLDSILPIRNIAETTMTEDVVLQRKLSRQRIRMEPYQTLTLRLTTLRPSSVQAPAGERPE